MLLLFVWGGLSAQPPAPPTTPTSVPTPTTPPETQVQFSVFVWPTEGILLEDTVIADIPRAFYRSPTGNAPVRLVRNSATPLFPYSGPLPLELYDIEEEWTDPPADAPEGTPPTMRQIPRVVIRTRFPIEWNRVMLVVFPDKRAEDGTLLTIPLPYDIQQLKPGMARIYNGSSKPLVLEFPDANNKALALPPFKNLDFSPENLTKALNSRVFVYGNSPNGQLEMLHTSKLFFEKETTNYFFLYPQGPRRIRILRIAGHAENAPPLPTPPPTAPQLRQ